jgi:hypothetical protein
MKFKLDECVDARLSINLIVELERIRIHESMEEEG